jgi:hypothetical protein
MAFRFARGAVHQLYQHGMEKARSARFFLFPQARHVVMKIFNLLANSNAYSFCINQGGANMKRSLSFFAIIVLLEAQSLQAQWIQTNGPYGGDVRCFAVNGSNLFAGTNGGGVWRRPLSGMVAGVGR